ncbi:MAG: hypothetical protein AAF901_10980 [Bacteroidota bacterium]
MKKSVTLFSVAALVAIVFSFQSCIINNPQPEECDIVTAKIVKITEGSSYDIVFHDTDSDFYYINRGLEQGLNLDDLNVKVLNKTVTLHLPKLALGTSNHIAQLAIGDEVIFTEFD